MNESVDNDALVMPSRMFSYKRGTLAFGDRLVVLVQHLGALDLLTGNERRVARIGDLHPAQHLPHDHFDVLVVDLHTLQPVDVLHFVDDVARERIHAQQAKDVVRISRAIDDQLALVHDLAVVHEHVFFLRNQEFMLFAVQIRDDQALLALRFLAERHRARHLGQHAGVFR